MRYLGSHKPLDCSLWGPCSRCSLSTLHELCIECVPSFCWPLGPSNHVQNALNRVMHAPVSFFDTTVSSCEYLFRIHLEHRLQPLGRIMNRFSKDIDTLDNIIGEAMRQFLGTIVQVIGSIILVSVIIPWFLIAIVFILVLYYWITIFYRASARELKVCPFHAPIRRRNLTSVAQASRRGPPLIFIWSLLGVHVGTYNHSRLRRRQTICKRERFSNESGESSILAQCLESALVERSPRLFGFNNGLRRCNYGRRNTFQRVAGGDRRSPFVYVGCATGGLITALGLAKFPDLFARLSGGQSVKVQRWKTT